MTSASDQVLAYETATPTEKFIDTTAFFLSLAPLVCLSTWYLYRIWGWYAPLTGFDLPKLTYANVFCLLILKNFIFMTPSLAAQKQKKFLMPQVLYAGVQTTIHFIAVWLVYRLFLA